MMEGSQRDSSDSPSLNCSPAKLRTDSFRQSFNDLPPLPTSFDDGTFHHETSVAMAVDDFSERVHDQLPSVESYKANAKSTSGANGFEEARRTHRRKILIIVAGAILFATLCLTLGIVIGRDEEEAAERPPATATYKTHPSPTSAPATYSYVNNHAIPTHGRPSRVDSVSAMVSTSSWSTIEALMDDESPQSMAVTWIADSDPMYLDLAAVDAFRNRYALAVLYYALNGPKWTYDIHWMSINHVCNWNDEWPRVSGGTIRVGIECDMTTMTIRSIFLPSMNLKGEIPPEIGLLSGLQEIDMFNNDIIGALPSEITKLSSLSELVLHGNFLSGSVPAWLSEIPSLEAIDLARNSLKGTIPSTYGKLTALTSLNLEFNELTGTLDPLKDVKSMEMLSLCDNGITGGLGSDILQSWSNLVELDLSNNKLVGYLPETLFQMTYLEVLDLHRNQFEGELPSAVSIDQRLEILSLSNNKLSGSMEVVTLLPYLHHLDLSYNLFDGTIPLEIGNLYRLKYLFLAFNPNLTSGPIPPQWDSLSELVDFSLQATNLIGEIPGELGLLANLVMLDLSGNQLSGAIPDDLGNLSQLTFLILKDNGLSGELPTTLKNLAKLDTLVIDGNDLSGGASVLCEPKLKMLQIFVSDCEEIGCSEPCCTKCCKDEDIECNNIRWFSPLDPTSGYNYERVRYKFNELDIIYPVPGEAANISEYYDTFGIPNGEN